MSPHRVLVVDDEANARTPIRDLLAGEGYETEEACDGEEGLARLQAFAPDVVLSDVSMPKLDGMQFLRRAHEQGSNASFIMMTAFGSIESAVEAVKAGAENYLVKPLEFEQASAIIQQTLEKRSSQPPAAREVEGRRSAARATKIASSDQGGRSRQTEEIPGWATTSLSMKHLIDLARRAGDAGSTVLITGESGSGKERVARLVHQESSRRAGPFIAVNCGAITETLLESELFGHMRGAFTGATQSRPGLFEAADGGTLLLDEVGEVSPGMQVKLLRTLQEREIRRVGDNNSRRVNVRVVAATNRDLAQAVSEGSLRQDFYYRLRVVELHVPSLRDRRDDILSLANELLAQAATRMKRTISGLAPAAADHLLRYEWPGNVRELENAMERAVALARGECVELEDLPEEICKPAASKFVICGAAARPLEEIEKEYILSVLELNGRNQVHAAKQLGIGTATLYRKLKSYRLSPDRAR